MTATLEPPSVTPSLPDDVLGAAANRPAGPAVRARRRITAGIQPLRPTVPVLVGLTLLVLVLWSLVYALFLSGLQESRDQKTLYDGYRKALALETAPLGGGADIGTPISLLSIPAAGVHDTIVVEGTSGDALRAGPGHVRSTVLPGQIGISVLYGRGLTAGAPFKHIAALTKGASIKVVTQQGTFTYVVDRVRHVGDLVAPAFTGGSRLVLVTSEGRGWRSGWAPSQPVYVDATLQGTARQGAGGQPTTVPTDELALQGDNDALVFVVLGLQWLLVSGVGIYYLLNRWSRIQLALIAVPIVVAGLWFTSEHALALLPNLI